MSTQVYEYVEDMPAALAEVRRALRPGGRLLVLDTDWGSLVWHSRDPPRMRRVVAAWDEHLADPHLPRRLPGHGGISEAETAAWADDLRSMGRDGFFSLGRYLFLATA